jgi:phosphonate transport system substrate-binding protein
LLIAVWTTVSCDRAPQESEAAGVIRLDRLEPLPAFQGENQTNTFKMAIAAVLSPTGNDTYYRPLIDYFAKALGRPARLIQRRNYQEINDLLARGGVDVAFVCTGAYLREKGSMELLVVPRIGGKTTYHSLLIVNANSPVGSFEQLRGKVFAFTDPLSQTGYFYPISLLEQMGEQPESFFARTIFTYSHDRSINAVARGLVDGAAVDHLVYDQLLAQVREHPRP